MPEYVYRVRWRAMSTSRWKIVSRLRLGAILRTHPNGDLEIERAPVGVWVPVSKGDLGG